MPALLLSRVLPSALILGETPFLPDASTISGAAYVAAGLSVLLFLYNQGVAALLNSRKLRAPGPEQTETDAKFEALETEIRAVELRMEKRLSEHLGGISARLDTLASSISHAINDMNYVVGKFDGSNLQR